MISASTVKTYNLTKPQVADMVRFVDKDPAAIAAIKKSEAQPMVKKSSSRKLGLGLHRVLSGSKIRLPPNPEPIITSSHSLGSMELSETLGCFDCCETKMMRRKTRTEKRAISQWARRNCSTRVQFFDCMSLTTRNVQKALALLRSVKDVLVYQNDPAVEAQGLTKIAGAIWLLTFAVQHLIDPDNTFPKLSSENLKIRGQYREIGLHIQQLLNHAEALSAKVEEMREYAVAIIKTLRIDYKLHYNPFELRGEILKEEGKVRRRLGPLVGEDGDGADAERTFQIHWTPLTLVFKASEDSSWENFASINIENKVRIFKGFCTFLLDFIVATQKRYRRAANPITNLITDVAREEPITSTLAEVVGAMLSYLKTSARASTEEISEEEVDSWRSPLEEFWINVDLLVDATHEVTALIRESRDVVRTCYVYTINFYHWKLTDFDDFDPNTKTKAFKKEREKMNMFVAKLLGHRRFSDAALFLSLADFTSSIYQEVDKNHAVPGENGMIMKLDTTGLVKEPSETWGLVGGREDIISVKPKGLAGKAAKEFVPPPPKSQSSIIHHAVGLGASRQL